MSTFGRGGLSQYSPLANVLRLTKDNYEAAIIRHGQVCRWLGGDKCSCLLSTGRPDPNCAFCHGSGWVYRHRTQKTKMSIKAFPVALNVFEIRDLSVAPVLELKSTSLGTPSSPSVINGRTLLIDGVPHGQPVIVDYVESRIIPSQVFRATVYAGVYLNVPGVSVQAGEITAPGDIYNVVSVTNLTTGVVYSVAEFMSNWIVIASPSVPIQPTDVLQVVVDVIFPPTLQITSETQKMVDQEWLQSVGGDAVMTYPNEYKVGEGDVVTPLSSDQTTKQVRTRTQNAYDIIPTWFVLEILDLKDNSGLTYVNGVDYILVGSNRILWLTSNAPAVGLNYELNFRYSPTYRVIQNLPNTRNSESQGLPGKVALKLFQAGGSVREGVL